MDPSNLFDFLFLRGRDSEHVVKIFLLIFLLNDHLHIVRMVVNVMNALPLILSTILIWIIVGCRNLFPTLVLNLGRVLCLFITVLCKGEFVWFR